MNHRKICPFVFCVFAILFLATCTTKDQLSIPVTGVEETTIPVLVEQAKEKVLKYVISSSRLEPAPPNTNWQLDASEQLDGEYRFYNDDWLMVIWSADTNEGSQGVVIINKVENTYWCGYVDPNGHLVDTAYIR